MADLVPPEPLPRARPRRAALSWALGVLAVLFVALYIVSAVWFGPPRLRGPSLVGDLLGVTAWTLLVVGLVGASRGDRTSGRRYRYVALISASLLLMAAGSVARWHTGWPRFVAAALLLGLAAGVAVMLALRGRGGWTRVGDIAEDRRGLSRCRGGPIA